MERLPMQLTAANGKRVVDSFFTPSRGDRLPNQ